MRAFPIVLILLLVAAASGCVDAGTTRVTRDQLDFSVVTSVQGITASPSGDVGLVGANGILVTSDASNHTVTLALQPLGAVVSTQGAFIACGPACDLTDATAGMIVADGSLISHNDIALNARGPERDSSIYFYDLGNQGGQYVRWSESANRFHVSSDVQIDGEFLAVGGPVGTATPKNIPAQNAAFVFTAALEGNSVAIYLRGSGVLANGTATIVFPTGFSALVGDGDITAQVTLTSKGPALWVSEKTKDHVTVETVTPTTSPVSFDYFVQAPRAGAESFRTFR